MLLGIAFPARSGLIAATATTTSTHGMTPAHDSSFGWLLFTAKSYLGLTKVRSLATIARSLLVPAEEKNWTHARTSLSFLR